MMSTSLLIVCVNFLQYLDQYGPPAHRKDQWNCYCDLQASLHQMCVMRWANGAILLKRLVHLSNTEHLVVLAEKKSLWTVSVREPNLGVSSILFLWISLLMSSTISMC